MKEKKNLFSLSDPEPVSLDSMFNEFYDRLVYFSFQIVRDKFLAQDIAQDAFIKYWSERESISSNKASIKSYLYTCVKNASQNVLRHHRVVEGYKANHPFEEADEHTVLDAMIAAEVFAEIHQVIQSLPGVYGKICKLSFFEGKNNQKVADELGISVHTIKKQKQKMLELLRLKLAYYLLLVSYTAVLSTL